MRTPRRSGHAYSFDFDHPISQGKEGLIEGRSREPRPSMRGGFYQEVKVILSTQTLYGSWRSSPSSWTAAFISDAFTLPAA